MYNGGFPAHLNLWGPNQPHQKVNLLACNEWDCDERFPFIVVRGHSSREDKNSQSIIENLKMELSRIVYAELYIGARLDSCGKWSNATV